MLKDVFVQLCGLSHWNDLAKAYSGKSRHYHNLDHLSNMLTQLEGCRTLITDWNAVMFALFYHDFVYNPIASDNEEKSAAEAEKVLATLNVPPRQTELVKELILATKSHQQSGNNDIDLFTDADLSILGSDSAEYETYTANVRKEYSIYPDLLYKPGRRKVLEHFLNMPYIFKTGYFRDRLEISARANISNELKKL
jgi:predicted metal-dependent HD superfamily phosphohydrolase